MDKTIQNTQTSYDTVAAEYADITSLTRWKTGYKMPDLNWKKP